jgi:acyl carrier protein phosphodiesterase
MLASNGKPTTESRETSDVFPDRLRSVAAIIAATKCWLARPPTDPDGPAHQFFQDKQAQTARHPDPNPCRFCRMSTDYLWALIREADRWLELNGRAPETTFGRLPADRQARQVREAAAV